MSEPHSVRFKGSQHDTVSKTLNESLESDTENKGNGTQNSNTILVYEI